LELQARECLRHLPELDVAGASSHEVPLGGGRELHVLHVQAVGLHLEHDLFLHPVPDRQRLVGGTCDGGQLVILVAEVHAVVSTLSAAPEDALHLGFIFD